VSKIVKNSTGGQMKENVAEMKQNIERIASKLESINHPRAKELRRIAQFFGDTGQSTNMAGGSGGYNPSFQNMADEGDTADEGEQESSMNPGISSFVKMRPGEEPVVDDRKTHTCTVIFKAPDGVSEADMMNYILGIGDQLGVDVESFKWSKSEAKQMKPAV
jgi:hypothetical protein